MTPFTKITGVAAALPMDNIDTDMIIPKQFLKTIKRTGLSEGLFYELRYREDGTRVDDFVLHREPFTEAKVLVAGENFGCGSSREHAPWALLDFGIRCVIAESFADIFFNNCFKNGILPIQLPKEDVAELVSMTEQASTDITIDLNAQIIRAYNKEYDFEIDPFRKQCLLDGLDDIGLTLEKETAIGKYETSQASKTPWLFGSAA